MPADPVIRQLGYCTNVHAGADLAQTRANLQHHALAVKQHFSPEQPMGIGLWLSAQAAQTLLDEVGVDALAEWLQQVGLIPYTMNGFPHGDFHQPVVKHRVYRPDWSEPSRAAYTLNLTRILDHLLPADLEGSISTLPVSWGRPAPSSDLLQAAAGQLHETARQLARLHEHTGRLLYVCLEPEPGCVLEKSEDVVEFFQSRLLDGGDEQAVRRHIRVCHDICHAAVMFEDQEQVLKRYESAGILVGKIQVSSAVRVQFETLEPSERKAALRQLSEFAEDRYLHQTVIQRSEGAPPEFFEDLPDALKQWGQGTPRGEWRIHFHVPIYLDRFDLLQTTQPQITQCLKVTTQKEEAHAETTRHYEVETYAWSVLPERLRPTDLAAGIASEMQWLQQRAPGCA